MIPSTNIFIILIVTCKKLEILFSQCTFVVSLYSCRMHRRMFFVHIVLVCIFTVYFLSWIKYRFLVNIKNKIYFQVQEV